MATSKTGGTNAQGSGGAAKRTGSTGTSKSGGAGDGRATASSGAAAGASAGETGARKAGGARGATGAGKTSRAAGGTGAKAKGDSKAAGGTGKRTTGAGAKGGNANLQRDLREFVQSHPGGWGHNEWIGLVNLLRDRGHDTSDTDAIGMALERERLTLFLERVPGLGAQRVKAIADKYPRIWNLMQANADEIAAVTNLPKAVAEKVRDAIH